MPAAVDYESGPGPTPDPIEYSLAICEDGYGCKVLRRSDKGHEFAEWWGTYFPIWEFGRAAAVARECQERVKGIYDHIDAFWAKYPRPMVIKNKDKVTFQCMVKWGQLIGDLWPTSTCESTNQALLQESR